MSTTEKEIAELEKKIEAAVTEEAKAVDSPAPETTTEPEAPSLPEAATTQPDAPESSKGFDAEDWLKKKGWKTKEDIAQSYREMEKAYHEKSVELGKLKEQPPAPPYGYPQQPQQGWAPSTPPQGYFPPPQAYAPPVNPWAPQGSRLTEEQVALSYGFDVQDFRRVMALSRDMAEVQARQQSQEFQRWKEEAEKTNEKNSDMTSAMSDPAFHDPNVQFEMHELFEKNPQLWNERRPLQNALSKALTNIGRRNVGAGATRPAGMNLPSAPPQTAGGNNASGGLPGKRIGTLPGMREAEKLSAKDLEKILRANGAVKSYADM